jgi:hypothetical protein
MVKKISYLIFAAAILTTGYFAFNRLHYWERSTGIFSFKSSDQPFHGRMGGDQDQFNAGKNHQRMRELNIPDSPHQQSRLTEDELIEKNSLESGAVLKHQTGLEHRNKLESGNGFETGAERMNRHGGNDFPGDTKINLRNSIWFLAVFASFAILTIYIDKVIGWIRHRR